MEAANMTLNQALRSLGLMTRPAENTLRPYAKDILGSDGSVLLEAVTAHEVWEWLRETGRAA